MDYRKDIISLPKNFAFDIFETNGMQGSPNILHFHDCLEINYIEEGSGVNIIEDKHFDIKPGELYIINNLEHHYAFSNGNLKMKVIVFDPNFIWQNTISNQSYIAPFYNRSIQFSNCIAGNNPITPKLLAIIREIDDEWTKEEIGYTMIVKSLLMKLLALLYRHFKSSNELGNDTKAFHQSYNRLKDVFSYIDHHLNDDLSLELLSKVALMNKTYFSSFFKDVMKTNVSEYIQTLRISHACRLLKTTNLSITNICTNCGFSTVSHFNKVFKKHVHQTPSSYRQTPEEKTKKS